MFLFILNVLFTVVILHQILFWVWFWQLKEYRWDRFRAGFSWKLLLQQFDLRTWWRPKWTLRAILCLFLALVLNVGIILTPLSCALAVGVVTPMFVFWKTFLVWRAKRKMKSFKGTVIGITGSYGKSMTKELLGQVLSIKYHVLCTQKNINSEIGVAQTVLKNLRGDEDFFIVEMGAYKIGEIKKICEMVRPKIGIITGIGDQHLELFGSLENIRRAKMELIESLPKDGFGIIGGEDFKLSDVKNLRQFKDHLEFTYEQQKYSVRLLGIDLARNIVGIIKVARRLGMTGAEIAEALKNLDLENIYPRLVTGENGVKIVDNSYNNSVEGFLSALDYLKVWKGYRKIVVTSGFLELGRNAKADWDRVVAKAQGVAQIFTGKDFDFKLDAKTVVLLQGRVSKNIKELRS